MQQNEQQMINKHEIICELNGSCAGPHYQYLETICHYDLRHSQQIFLFLWQRLPNKLSKFCREDKEFGSEGARNLRREDFFAAESQTVWSPQEMSTMI